MTTPSRVLTAFIASLMLVGTLAKPKVIAEPTEVAFAKGSSDDTPIFRSVPAFPEAPTPGAGFQPRYINAVFQSLKSQVDKLGNALANLGRQPSTQGDQSQHGSFQPWSFGPFGGKPATGNGSAQGSDPSSSTNASEDARKKFGDFFANYRPGPPHDDNQGPPRDDNRGPSQDDNRDPPHDDNPGPKHGFDLTQYLGFFSSDKQNYSQLADTLSGGPTGLNFGSFGAKWLEQFQKTAADKAKQISEFMKSVSNDPNSFKWPVFNATSSPDCNITKIIEDFKNNNFKWGSAPWINCTKAWSIQMKAIFAGDKYSFKQTSSYGKTKVVKALHMKRSNIISVCAKDEETNGFSFLQSVVVYDLVNPDSKYIIVRPTNPRFPCIILETDLTVSGLDEQLLKINDTLVSDVPLVRLDATGAPLDRESVQKLRDSNLATVMTCGFSPIVNATPEPIVAETSNGNPEQNNLTKGSKTDIEVAPPAAEKPESKSQEVSAFGVGKEYIIRVKVPASGIIDFGMFGGGGPPSFPGHDFPLGRGQGPNQE